MNKSYKLATKTYAGIPDKFAKADHAEVILTSIPYDGTSTWGKGADKGFQSLSFCIGKHGII
jgi:DNA-directed RNA polymerase